VNQDGTVSAQERIAYAFKQLMACLQSIQNTSSIGAGSSSTTTTTSVTA
jgi:hypothetical protein